MFVRRSSAAKRLLRLWVRIPPGAWMFVSCECLCCQVEISATDRSLVQRSPTDCGVSECDQVKTNTLDTCCEQVEEGRTTKRHKLAPLTSQKEGDLLKAFIAYATPRTIYSLRDKRQSQWPRNPKGVGLWPIGFWKCVLESCRGYGCLSLLSDACCTGKGLCGRPIPRPEEFYRAFVYHSVWSGATITLYTYIQ
jgi:hypothetical protein